VPPEYTEQGGHGSWLNESAAASPHEGREGGKGEHDAPRKILT
jgi:hypothetical protein